MDLTELDRHRASGCVWDAVSMPRLAICSDLHSKIERLRLVLEHIAARGVDEMWCLGDLVGGGPDPIRVIDAVQARPLVLSGNHDAWLTAGSVWPQERAALGEGRLSWLAQLQPEGRAVAFTPWRAVPRRGTNSVALAFAIHATARWSTSRIHGLGLGQSWTRRRTA